MFDKIIIASAGFVGGVGACLYAEAKIVKAVATPELKQEAKEVGWLLVEEVGYMLVKAAEKPGRSPVPMRRGRGRPVNQTPGYTKYSIRGFTERKPMVPSWIKQDLTFESIDVANEVLIALRDILNRYGAVTINDLADVVGSKKTRTFHDEGFGWTDLSEAVILDKTLVLPDIIRFSKEN